MYQGACQCAAVQIVCHAPPVVQLVCHCQQCRDFAKYDFSSLAFFKKTDVEISADNFVTSTVVAASGSEVERLACARCQMPLFEKTQSFASIIGIHANVLAAEFEFQEDFHVWAENKCQQVKLPETVKIFQQGAQ